jgi:hypothetical protein
MLIYLAGDTKAVFNPALTSLSYLFSDGRTYISLLSNRGGLRSYRVVCTTDYPGNDFSNPHDEISLEQCAALCNQNAGCIGVALNSRGCS